MATGRPKTELILNDDEREQLASLARSRALPHGIVARARVVLWSAAGRSNTEIAERVQWTKATVGKWRKRFIDRRVAGLYDELRSGRPRSIEDEKIAVLLRRTLSRKPKAATHWTVRGAAAASGISKSTVHRLFRAFAVQPHREEIQIIFRPRGGGDVSLDNKSRRIICPTCRKPVRPSTTIAVPPSCLDLSIVVDDE